MTDKEDIYEEVPVNNAGGNNIAGVDMPFVRNMMMRQKDMLGNHKIFDVDSETFQKCLFGKPKFARYKKYMSLNDFPNVAEEIKKYAKRNPKKKILLRDNKTGRMVFMKGLMESNTLLEAKEVSPDEVIKEIEKSFKKYFPKGFIDVSGEKDFAGKTITVQWGLVGDERYLPNKIRRNDPMYGVQVIFVRDGGVYETSGGTHGLHLKPSKDSYLAMELLKHRLRKTKGDGQKMIKTFDNFFKKLAQMVKENKDKIYGADNIKKFI